MKHFTKEKLKEYLAYVYGQSSTSSKTISCLKNFTFNEDRSIDMSTTISEVFYVKLGKKNNINAIVYVLFEKVPEDMLDTFCEEISKIFEAEEHTTEAYFEELLLNSFLMSHIDKLPIDILSITMPLSLIYKDTRTPSLTTSASVKLKLGTLNGSVRRTLNDFLAYGNHVARLIISSGTLVNTFRLPLQLSILNYLNNKGVLKLIQIATTFNFLLLVGYKLKNSLTENLFLGAVAYGTQAQIDEYTKLKNQGQIKDSKSAFDIAHSTNPLMALKSSKINDPFVFYQEFNKLVPVLVDSHLNDEVSKVIDSGNPSSLLDKTKLVTSIDTKTSKEVKAPKKTRSSASKVKTT